MTLRIRLNELVNAFLRSDEAIGYVDIEQGRVIFMGDDAPGGGIDYDADDEAQLSRAMDMEDNWERYVALPNIEDYEMKAQLVSFAGQLEDDVKKEKLFDSLHGVGAITRTKRLIKNLSLDEEWARYRTRCMMALAREFCEENQIEYEE